MKKSNIVAGFTYANGDSENVARFVDGISSSGIVYYCLVRVDRCDSNEGAIAIDYTRSIWSCTLKTFARWATECCGRPNLYVRAF